MPDVLVEYQGLRTAIEGEYAAPQAQDKALESATRRVALGIAFIGVAIVYPAALKELSFEDLPHALERAALDIAVISEAGQTSYVTGNVEQLERILRSAYDQLIKEDVVAEAVALIDAQVESFARLTAPHRGVWQRISKNINPSITEEQLEGLSTEQRIANCRIGGLIILNAMIFHEILTDVYPKIVPLRKIMEPKKHERIFSNRLVEQWNYILHNINFYSIFHLAKEVFTDVPDGIFRNDLVFKAMADTAQKISFQRTALSHDLMGRVYHRLLADAKYLGTYYTSIPAGRLLLTLALRPQGWDVAWSNDGALAKLKIADLACGTGTLLTAAAESVLDNFISHSVQMGTKVTQDRLNLLHQRIAEDILHGYDVLPSAIHLTASTLAVRSPNVPFKKMNLYAMPYGGEEQRLGSLEFLGGNLMQLSLAMGDMFSPPEQASQMSGQGEVKVRSLSLPELDLCVMNPPFVRSTANNLLFGSIPDIERDEMQTKLKKLVKSTGIQASITSGLGSVFVALGNRHIRPGGRLALVLPKALFSGVSWRETRNLINHDFNLDFLVVSHDAERWNFSESTDLSEALLVATKKSRNGNGNGNGHAEGKASAPPTVVVNLWRNPRNSVEAITIAQEALRMSAPDFVTGAGAQRIIIGGQTWGEILSVDASTIQADWFLPCAFAQSDLARIAYRLLKGELWLPTQRKTAVIPITKLESLGSLGYDIRDIRDGFEPVDSPTPFPAFWSHDSKAVLTMKQTPNRYLMPLDKPAKGRERKRDHYLLWQSASRIVISARARLNTQKLQAVLVNERVLASSWWTFLFEESLASLNNEKALVLWLTSSLSALSLLSIRTETEGPWVNLKKPTLHAMPVLDIRALSEAQVAQLAAAYDDLATRPLLPLPQMAQDETRRAIDDAISSALGLPDLSLLRTMLGREPVISMKRLG